MLVADQTETFTVVFTPNGYRKSVARSPQELLLGPPLVGKGALCLEFHTTSALEMCSHCAQTAPRPLILPQRSLQVRWDWAFKQSNKLHLERTRLDFRSAGLPGDRKDVHCVQACLQAVCLNSAGRCLNSAGRCSCLARTLRRLATS